MPIVGAELPPEMLEEIEKLAKENYTSKSAIIRKLIADGLKKMGRLTNGGEKQPWTLKRC